MDKERFSLLLLEPGETYFEDFSAYCIKFDPKHEDLDSKKTIGRLKMCSKSIVFDPRDIVVPLIKIPLRECTKIYEWAGELMRSLGTQNVLAIDCLQYVHMLSGNIIAPYTFISEKQTFLFALNYVTLNEILGPMSQLLRAATLPAAEQSSMIAAINFSRQSRVTFDSLWLEDLSEKVVLELAASKISPLVVNPGRILLSTNWLYFQLFNNIEKTPVLKFRLQDISGITKRRFLLRHLGLEIICRNGNATENLYLALDSPEDRDKLYEGLKAQDLNLDETGQAEMTLQWQNGVISNYEYLLFLNSQADRSFSDLTQYPVFPWIVADVTSNKLDFDNPLTFRDLKKPVGALNNERLTRLLERYEEMDPPKFLYGSHYSAPGLVLFYLVRRLPHLMLCLQNGRFDHPDRMFNSLKDVWKNINTSMADFKELIPEFYNTESEGDFCLNLYGINFGYRHDGVKVGDVELPPWAEGSPKKLVNQLREALESDHVSQNLHNWIDLIFGFKQTGPEAHKSLNVFYPLCYEGGVDLTAERDFNKRHALEVQIMEFGQIPRQLFNLAHPARTRVAPKRSLSLSLEEREELVMKENSKKIETKDLHIYDCDGLAVIHSLRAHRELVSSVALEGSRAFSVGHDGVLKVYTARGKEVLRSATLSNLALSCCVVLPGGSTVLAGSWDNHIASYQVEFGRGLHIMQAHEDSVTSLAWRPGLLATGSWDCSVRLWRVDENVGRQAIRPTTAFLAELDHEDRVACIDMNAKSLTSGTEEGDVLLWDLETHEMTQKLPSHTGKTFVVKFSPDGRKMISCGEDGTFKVIDVSSGMQVYSKEVGESLRCLAWDGCTLLLGGSEGNLYVWDLVQVRQANKIKAHLGAVTSVALSNNGLVVTGSEDKTVTFWEPYR